MKSDKGTISESEGQNAYGAKVKVKHYSSRYDYLAIHNYYSYLFCPNGFLNCNSISFEKILNMGLEEAKASKDNIAALIIGKPTYPFTSFGSISSGATFSSPSSMDISMSYLHLDLLEVWFYNTETGEIISKITGK